MSKVLWEGIPTVGSKAREGAKAMSLAGYCWISPMCGLNVFRSGADMLGTKSLRIKTCQRLSLKEN